MSGRLPTSSSFGRWRLGRTDSCGRYLTTSSTRSRLDLRRAVRGPGARLDWVSRWRLANAKRARAHAAATAFTGALLAFRDRPSSSHVFEALRALESVVDICLPRDRAFTIEQLRDALDHLVREMGAFPPVAREFLASLVEERFAAERDVRGVPEMRGASGFRQPPWTPSWEVLASPSAPAEPPGVWFVGELQVRYEDRRLARQIEEAHADALAEEERRLRVVADEERAREEERRVAEERKREVAAARKREEDHQHNLQRARQEAPRNVAARLPAGITLKHIPEPDRTHLVMKEVRALMRVWEGG
jgi:hypothetical protein